jgi:hypothetical protein
MDNALLATRRDLLIASRARRADAKSKPPVRR